MTFFTKGRHSMKRMVKWLVYGVGALLILLILAVVILPLIIDPNDYKDRIESTASDAIGRDVRLEGDIEWNLFPGLSLAMGPVSIANVPGFGNEPLLRAEHISASVRLMPLLKKKVEIGAVGLQSVTLNLQVDASGATNWEGVGGDNDPQPQPGASDMSLSVESISFVDGTIDYSDASTQTKLLLSNVTLETSAIAAGRSTSLDLAADYVLNGDLAGAIGLQGSVLGMLGDQPVEAVLSNFELTQNAEPQIRFASDSVTINLAGNGMLRIPEYSVRSHNMELSGNVQSDHLLDGFRLSGQVTILPFEPGQWLRATGLYTEATTDDSALQRLEGEIDWRLTDVVTISRLNLTLDDTVLRGSATAGDSIQFELNADQLNADRYLPPPTDAATTDAPPTDAPTTKDDAPVDPLVLPALDGSLSVGTFSLAGMTASNVLLKLSGDEDGLRILPIRGQMYGGTFEGSLDLTEARSDPVATTRLDLARIDGGELLHALAGSRVLSGLGSLNADLRVVEPFSADPVATLNGDIQFEFRDGRIHGFDITNVYQQVLQLADSSRAEAMATDFSRLGFRARITDGVLQTDTFDLASDVLRVRGGGTINLAQGTIDFDLSPTLLKTPDGASGLARLEGVEIPLKITGQMTAPAVKFDAAGALLASQQDRLEGKLREKLGLDEQESNVSGNDEGPEGLEELLLDALDKELNKQSDKNSDGDGSGSESERRS